MAYFDHNILKDLMYKLLKSIDVNDLSAFHVTESIIDASLKGVDSHGINLYPHYYKAFIGGRLNKNPEIKTVTENKSTLVLDADSSVGHYAGSVAIEKSIDLARNTGVGMCSVRNSSHFGTAAYFALQASAQNMIGMAFTNSNSLVKVPNGYVPFFGTNPICFTAPVEGEEPFCLDMATSVTTWNKVRNNKNSNLPLEDNLAFDINGQITNNPHKAHSLQPIGDYKGFGLGMMVEILCSLLADGPAGHELLPMFNSSLAEKRNISHFFVAIDISKFTTINRFSSRMKNIVEMIRNLNSLNQSPVLVPGDPEKLCKKQRLISGIEILQHNLDEFLNLSPEFLKALK